ncbi:MAG: hypothetical protein ACRDUA_03775 [Micromonosporaceae bacterium]
MHPLVTLELGRLRAEEMRADAARLRQSYDGQLRPGVHRGTRLLQKLGRLAHPGRGRAATTPCTTCP